jgi:hypothetical protein
MKLVHLALAAVATVAAIVAHAQAQYTLEPANPGPLDTVSVRKAFNNEDGTRTRVVMSGNRITVRLQSMDAFFPEPLPGLFEQAIGRLPAGTYQVEVVYVNATGEVTSSLGTTSFTVAPHAAGQPIDDHSDIWWNPDESGWGMNVAQHADGQLYAMWFLYAADGSPAWYVMPGGRWTSAREFDGDVYRATGPDMAHFSADAVTRTKVGTARLLVGGSEMTAIFDFDDTHVTRKLVRLGF